MSADTVTRTIAAAPAAPRAARPRMRWGSETIAGAIIVGGLIAVALLAPVLAPASPTAGDIGRRLFDVGTNGNILGTDGQGRDILTRLIWGARPALIGGITPVLIAGVIGTALGMIAGLAPRIGRSAIMRTLDVLYAFPAILLAVAIGAALGPGVVNSIVSLAVVLIAPIARVAEAEVLRVRSADFIDVARASGASRALIAIRQVLPNIAPTLIVYGTSLIGLAIVYSAGLSFLGLGVTPPEPDWGQMLNDLRQFIYDRPLLSLVPAAAILLASIGFNLLGDGLKRRLEVRDGEALL